MPDVERHRQRTGQVGKRSAYRPEICVFAILVDFFLQLSCLQFSLRLADFWRSRLPMSGHALSSYHQESSLATLEIESPAGAART